MVLILATDETRVICSKTFLGILVTSLCLLIHLAKLFLICSKSPHNIMVVIIELIEDVGQVHVDNLLKIIEKKVSGQSSWRHIHICKVLSILVMSKTS